MSDEKLPISSGEDPSQVFNPLIPPAEPAPPAPMYYGALPPLQPPYQVYYAPPGAGSTEDPILQPLQTTAITLEQPSNVPDYLCYSLFTMFCCCLPLGIAALVYAIQARDANCMGRTTAAKQNSKWARNFAHSAITVRIVIIALDIIRVVVFRDEF